VAGGTRARNRTCRTQAPDQRCQATARLPMIAVGGGTRGGDEMARWLDFAGSPPGAATIAANGYVGVLRDIRLGGTWKLIQAAEGGDGAAHGLKVRWVAEGGRDDAWGSADDSAAGRDAETPAVSDARAKGIPDPVHIACAAGAHAANQQQIDDCVRYAAA